MSQTRGFLYRQRFGYGMGDFACNLIWQVISLYLLYFYTDVMQLNAKAIAAMFVVCRVIDAITDVLVGFAIDKTKTRWGKSRPWFLFGAVPFAVAAFLAFSVPNISPSGKLVYAYATYIFLSFMYTVVNIPLASILPSLTDDMNERTVLATWRKFLAFLGSTIVSATALTMVQLIGRGNEALGFRVVMGIFGVVGCLCFFLTFALNILFMWTGYFMQSSALVYYYKYYVGSTSMASLVATIMSMVPMVANLTVISHDAPDEKTSASLVASTQVFWQIGVLGSYAMAFIVSRVQGAAGARMVFGLLAVFAAIAFLWRTFSGKFKEFHAEGDKFRAAEGSKHRNKFFYAGIVLISAVAGTLMIRLQKKHGVAQM